MKVYSVISSPTFNLQQQNNYVSKKQNPTPYNIKFKGLLPKSTLASIRMCVYDLDETLLEGSQITRNKILNFSKAVTKDGINRVLVYSSSRPLKYTQPFIDDKTLIMPDYYVANNGMNIYRRNNTQFEEIQNWSETLAKGFNKNKIREFMIRIAKSHMFSEEEWSKVPTNKIPDTNKEFRGSKLSEYVGHESPLNIRFIIAPEIYSKILPEIQQNLKASGLDQSNLTLHHYSKEQGTYEGLRKYFSPEKAEELSNHYAPRLYPDGSYDVLVISAPADKGKATEHIRESLGLKPNEILAAGDDINDLSHANKGYFFAMVSNATEVLKKMLTEQTDNPGIIRTSKPGVDGIWEVIG